MTRSTSVLIVANALLICALAYIFALSNLSSHQMDLAAYIAAARRLVQGRSLYAEIYDQEISEVMFSNTAAVSGAFTMYFRYPPFLAAVLSPLAFSSWPVVKMVWMIILFCSAIGAAAVLAQLLGIIKSFSKLHFQARFLIVLLSFFAFNPVFLGFAEGQVDLLILFLLLLYAKKQLQTSGGDYAAGIFLGAAASLKVIPALFLVFAIKERRYGQLWGFFGFCLVWTIFVTFAFPAPNAVIDLFANYQNLLSNALESALLGNFSFDSILYLWNFAALAPLCSVAIKIGVLVASWKLASIQSSAEQRLISLFKVSALLVLLSSTMFAHHLVWTLPLLISSFLITDRDKPRGFRVSAVGICSLLLLSYAYVIYMMAHRIGPSDLWVTPVSLSVNFLVLWIVLRTSAADIKR